MKTEQYSINQYAQLTAYLHTPNEEMKNLNSYPAILILPGGGFYICSEREAEPVAMTFFAQGFQAFVLKYTTVTAKKRCCDRKSHGRCAARVKTNRRQQNKIRHCKKPACNVRVFRGRASGCSRCRLWAKKTRLPAVRISGNCT